MAYDSPRSSTRGAPVRNGRGSARGGGGQNLAALAIAAVLVVGIIVVVVVTSGGGDKPAPKPAVAGAPKAPPPSTGPVKPAEKPYPVVPPETISKGRTLVGTFSKRSSDADRLYKESLQAKQSGDTATWQSKLREARQLLESINDEWNDFEQSLPAGNGYDFDQVAERYFKAERGQVAKYTKPLAAMKTDQR